MKLQKQYEDQGFVIIAPHAQNVPQDDVVAFLRQNKVNFTVTSGGGVQVPDRLSGIPAAYLFNSKGELVEAGRPSSMKNSITGLIDSEPHYLAAGIEYDKTVGKLAAALKKTKAYGTILDRLDKEIKKDGETAAEAKFLADNIRGFGKKRYFDARKLEASDAYAAMSLYSELKVSFKGDKAGDKAGERIAELKKDKDFQKELKAGEVATKISAECQNLVVNTGQTKPVLTSGPNKKTAAKVRAMARVLFGKYGDSKAAERTKSELESYGFDV
mgnify:CR=1 FL=1